MLVLVSKSFKCLHYKIDACFHMSIALMVVWGCCCLLYAQVSRNFFEAKSCLHLTLLFWVPILWKKLPWILLLSCLQTNFLSFWWLRTSCGNLKCRDSAYCSDRTYLLQRFPMFFPVSHGEWFSLCTVSAKNQETQNLFTVFSTPAFMFIQ